MALCVQVYLQMDRLDQAERQIRAMAAVDDDATLSQLAQAWVGLHQVRGAVDCAGRRRMLSLLWSWAVWRWEEPREEQRWRGCAGLGGPGGPAAACG